MHPTSTTLLRTLSLTILTLGWFLITPSVSAQSVSGLYVTSQGNFSDNNGSVTFYDSGTEQATQVLAGADFKTLVQSITLHDNLGYVMSNTSEAIDILDLSTHQRIGQIPGVASPRYMAIVGEDKAYVSNLFANTVTIIQLSDNSIAGTVDVGANPEDIAVLGSRAYVANFGFGFESTLTVIDTQTDTVLDTIDLGCDAPRHLELDAEGELWAFCVGKTVYNDDFTEIIEQTNGAVVVLNGTSGEVVTRFDLDFQVGTMSLGQDTYYSATRQQAFLLHGTELLVFDTASNTQQASIQLSGDEDVGGIAYDATADRFYAARIVDFTTPGFVSIHDSTGTEVARFDAGIAPGHIALGLDATRTDLEQITAVPERFQLMANYPNPFNPSTIIPFELTQRGHVTLTIFDILGREVGSLVDEVLAPGRYETTWEAGTLASGVYITRLALHGRVITRQLVLTK